MSSKHETRDLLVRYAKARIPLITIRTDERRRAIEILTEVAEELGVKVYCHTKSKGSMTSHPCRPSAMGKVSTRPLISCVSR